MNKNNKQLYKSVISVSTFNLVALVLGFVNQIIIAYYFGTSKELDNYLMAYAVPSMLMGIFGTIFSSSLIPVLTPAIEVEEEFREAIISTFFIALTIAVCVSLGGYCAREFVLHITTNLSQENVDSIAKLSGLMWFIVGFSVLIGFMSALHQLSKRFFMPAMIWLFPSSGMILGTVFLANKIGIIGLVIGYLFSVILSFVCMLPILLKIFSLNTKIRLKNKYSIEFLKAIVPISISLMPFSILPTIDAFWISNLPPGSMSYLGYSTRLNVALLSLVVNGIYMVILPYLSEDVEKEDTDLFLNRIRSAIKAVMVILIPVVIFGICYKHEIIEILFKRGMFTDESVRGVASVLPFYLLGLLGIGPTTIITRTYFAKKEFAKIGAISAVVVTIYFIVSGFLSRVNAHVGIGISYVIYSYIFLIANLVFLKNKIISFDFLRELIKITICAFCSVLISYWMAANVSVVNVHLKFAIGFASASIAYISLSYLWKIEETTIVIKYVFRHMSSNARIS